MKKIFATLAVAAAMFAFVSCGPSVSGNPAEDAKTFLELSKSDPEAAAKFNAKVTAEYGNTDKYQEYAGEVGSGAVNEMRDALGF